GRTQQGRGLLPGLRRDLATARRGTRCHGDSAPLAAARSTICPNQERAEDDASHPQLSTRRHLEVAEGSTAGPTERQQPSALCPHARKCLVGVARESRSQAPSTLVERWRQDSEPT